MMLPDFQKLFRKVVVAFQPRALSPDTLATYYEALKGYPLEIVDQAARLIIRTQRFFPSVAEWIRATQHLAARPLQGAARSHCQHCRGRGLIKIAYESGEPFDVAICGCLTGLFYRKTGVDFVRLQLNLTAKTHIAYLEDFESDDSQTRNVRS
jgi:hypothetical protein